MHVPMTFFQSVPAARQGMAVLDASQLQRHKAEANDIQNPKPLENST